MKLEKIIEDLLFSEGNSGRLRDAAAGYYKFLSEITELTEQTLNNEDDIETILENGKAISPRDAARCILDYSRTSGFLRGLYAAICKAKKSFPNEKIEILYAGCGPFAALAVPFCSIFSPEEICFTLIDIHKRSLDSARKVFRHLECENFISEYIQTDATVFRSENYKKFHIIVTETMQKTLEKEPQVMITLNLLKLLHENGIFIPQKITIEACLTELKKEFSFNFEVPPKRERISLGKIFELSTENSADHKNIFLPKTLEFPTGFDNSIYLILLTKIKIFGSIMLNDYHSGLTYPTILHDIGNFKAGQKIEFRYVTDENPRFVYQIL